MQDPQDNGGPDARAIFAAMQEELGIQRLDVLPLQDRGQDIALAPVRQPSQIAAPGVLAWNSVVFDDVDPSLNELDPLNNGQLYRMRKQANAPARDDSQGNRGGRSAGSGRGGYQNVGNRGQNTNDRGERQSQARNSQRPSSMTAATSSPAGRRRGFANTSPLMDKTVARLRAKPKRGEHAVSNSQPRGVNDDASTSGGSSSSSTGAARTSSVGSRRSVPRRPTPNINWNLASADTFSLGPTPAQTQPTLVSRSTESFGRDEVTTTLIATSSEAEVISSKGSAPQIIKLPSGGGLGASRWAATPPPPPPAQSLRMVEKVPSQSLDGKEVSATSSSPNELREMIKTLRVEVRIGNEPVRSATLHLTRLSKSHPVVLEICLVIGAQRIFNTAVPKDAGLRLDKDSLSFRHDDLTGHGQAYWTIIFKFPHDAQAIYGTITRDAFRPAQVRQHDTEKTVPVPSKQVDKKIAPRLTRGVGLAVEEDKLSAYPSTTTCPSDDVASQNVAKIESEAVDDLLIDFTSTDEIDAPKPSRSTSDDLKLLTNETFSENVLKALDSRYEGSFLSALFSFVEESAMWSGREFTLDINAPINDVLWSSDHLAAAEYLVNDLFCKSEAYTNLDVESGEEYLADMSRKVLAKALLLRDDGLVKAKDSGTTHDDDSNVQVHESQQGSTPRGSTTWSQEKAPFNSSPNEDKWRRNDPSRITYQIDDLLSMRSNAIDMDRVLLPHCGTKRKCSNPNSTSTSTSTSTSSTFVMSVTRQGIPIIAGRSQVATSSSAVTSMGDWDTIENAVYVFQTPKDLHKTQNGHQATQPESSGQIQQHSVDLKSSCAVKEESRSDGDEKFLPKVSSIMAGKQINSVPTRTASAQDWFAFSGDGGISEKEHGATFVKSSVDACQTGMVPGTALKANSATKDMIPDHKSTETIGLTKVEQPIERCQPDERLNLNSNWAPEKKSDPVNASASAATTSVRYSTSRETPSTPDDLYNSVRIDFSNNPGLQGSRWAAPELKDKIPARSSQPSMPHPSAIVVPTVVPMIVPMIVPIVHGHDLVSGSNDRLAVFPPCPDMHHRNLPKSSDMDSFTNDGIEGSKFSHDHQDNDGVDSSRPALSPVRGNGSMQATLQARLDESILRR